MSQEMSGEGDFEDISFVEEDAKDDEENKNKEEVNNKDQQQDNQKEELEKIKENEKNQNENKKEEKKLNSNPFSKTTPQISEGTNDINLYSKLSGEIDNKIDNKNTVSAESSNENINLKKIKIIGDQDSKKENNKKFDNNEVKKSEEEQNQKSQESTDLNKNFSNTYETKYSYIEDDENIKSTRLKDLEGCSYLSSILRSVMSSDDLKKYFLDEFNAIKITESLKVPNRQGQRLSYATLRLFKHFYSDLGEIYEPKSFLKVLQEKNALFKFNSEMNPIVCLNEVLNQLHDELNVASNNNNPLNCFQTDKNDVIEKGKINFLSKNDSIISQNYSWFQLEEIRCPRCGGRKYRFQGFFTFDLDIANVFQEVKKNELNIYDCLDEWDKKRKKKMYCDIRCNDFSEMECSKRIINTPNIFVFMIDRNNFDEKLMEINFGLDENINLYPYMDYSGKNVNYQLKAIVSIIEKKYINFAKIDNDWYAFDNTNIQKVGHDDIFKTHRVNSIKHIPCILLYEHIQNNNQINN